MLHLSCGLPPAGGTKQSGCNVFCWHADPCTPRLGGVQGSAGRRPKLQISAGWSSTPPWKLIDGWILLYIYLDQHKHSFLGHRVCFDDES